MHVIAIPNGKDPGCYFAGCIMPISDAMEVPKLGENRSAAKVEYFETTVDTFRARGGRLLERGPSEGL